MLRSLFYKLLSILVNRLEAKQSKNDTTVVIIINEK